MELEKVVEQLRNYLQNMETALEYGTDSAETYIEKIKGLIMVLQSIVDTFPGEIVGEYKEYFVTLIHFCTLCQNDSFLVENVDELMSSLILLDECLDEIAQKCEKRIHICPCCGKRVIYLPLPNYYKDMQNKYGCLPFVSETLNEEQYLCPSCACSDRDRMIVSFLEKANLVVAEEGTAVLQIAPAKSIDFWIRNNCPHLVYHTTDLFMDGVTFSSDIQDMQGVKDGTYDLIICSHVLEHVPDDEKALCEMKRILKEDGKIVFLVPIDLKATEIDEEWGCSEEENWRRFGQEDHCRRYNKQGLMERLKKYFSVAELGKEYFGEAVFNQCGLTDTSILYLLTKSDDIPLSFNKEIQYDEELLNNGPLVTVIMSCYNHEPFVAEAIESVIHQSYKNIEFLVADDASQDNSVEVMKRYEKYYTKYFYHKTNIGGRQEELIDLSNGKYIALMNSDDIWDLDKIYLQVAYMEKHPETGICFTWCKYVDEMKNPIDDNLFIMPNLNQYQWMRFFWEHGNALCNPSTLARSEYRKKLQINGRDCRQLPDYFNWIELIQCTSFYVVPKVLIQMRRFSIANTNNVSAGTQENLMRHLLECGTHWIWAIARMEKEFFINCFGNLFINKEAQTDEEIKCEKFFLLLSNKNRFVRNSAFTYLASVYSEIFRCMNEEYHYTIRDIANDILQKGVANIIDWGRWNESTK